MFTNAAGYTVYRAAKDLVNQPCCQSPAQMRGEREMEGWERRWGDDGKSDELRIEALSHLFFISAFRTAVQ